MSNGILIVPATVEHGREIAARLRAADAIEIEAAGHEIGPTIEQSIGLSVMAECALEDGVPVAVWGVCVPSMFGAVGVPWLLGTDRMAAHRKAFLRGSRAWVQDMAAAFPVLENYVHVDHRESVRWLTWLGFTIHPAAPWGVLGEPFHRFTMGDGEC